jgi:CheY-like chemotaxis protein
MSDILSILGERAKEKNLPLNVVLESEIPKTIITDPLRLRQILINVIANAIKFTDRGEVSVKIRMASLAAEQSPRIEFIITDTGIGISAEGAKKLFSPFTQADSSTARKYGGTGLGLILSQKLARALGGDLILGSSIPNVGTTFIASIETGDLNRAIWTENLELKSEIRDAVVDDFCASRPINNLRVLIVDDVREIRELYSYFLERAGASVQIAKDGFEAVEFVKRGPLDVILMDIQMPGMDGYQATKQIRNNGYIRYIFALTAHALKEEKDRCFNSGFDDYLIKPVQPAHLIAKLQSLDLSSTRVIPHSDASNNIEKNPSPRLDEIKSRFFYSLVGRAEKIRDSVQTRNWSEVGTLAHQIRGTAGAFNFQSLTGYAGKIEDAIRAGDSDDEVIKYCKEFDEFTRKVIRAGESGVELA